MLQNKDTYQIAKLVAHKHGISVAAAEKIVREFFKKIKEKMEKGNDINIDGFGKIESKKEIFLITQEKRKKWQK